MQCRITIVSSLTSTSLTTRLTIRCCSTTSSVSAVRRNAGAAGVDGATVADVESFGVDRWLEALARDLKAGTYRPQPVRQVLIPKKQRGKFPRRSIHSSAFPASGTGWRRRRRCWCYRRSSRPTCNRSSMRTGRADTRTTLSTACTGC